MVTFSDQLVEPGLTALMMSTTKTSVSCLDAGLDCPALP